MGSASRDQDYSGIIGGGQRSNTNRSIMHNDTSSQNNSGLMNISSVGGMGMLSDMHRHSIGNYSQSNQIQPIPERDESTQMVPSRNTSDMNQSMRSNRNAVNDTNSSIVVGSHRSNRLNNSNSLGREEPSLPQTGQHTEQEKRLSNLKQKATPKHHANNGGMNQTQQNSKSYSHNQYQQ